MRNKNSRRISVGVINLCKGSFIEKSFVLLSPRLLNDGYKKQINYAGRVRTKKRLFHRDG